jgi:hypothetical protein
MTKKIHLASTRQASLAFCGANQGSKLRSRVLTTSDIERVTCKACVNAAARATMQSFGFPLAAVRAFNNRHED